MLCSNKWTTYTRVPIIRISLEDFRQKWVSSIDILNQWDRIVISFLNKMFQNSQTAWLQTKRTYTCISVFSHTSSHSASVLSSRVKNTVIPYPIFLVISAITSWHNLLRPLNSCDICNKKIVISFTHQRMNSNIPNFLIRTFMLLFATHKTNIRWGKEAPQKQIKLDWHQFWWKTSWVMQFS